MSPPIERFVAEVHVPIETRETAKSFPAVGRPTLENPAKTVILSPLLPVREGLVGLVYLLELLFVAAGLVRVIFMGKPAIGLLYLVLARLLLHAQNLVVVVHDLT